MKVISVDFDLDNAERNKTVSFRSCSRSTVFARRGNAFNFKVDLDRPLFKWQLQLTHKDARMKFDTRLDSGIFFLFFKFF